MWLVRVTSHGTKGDLTIAKKNFYKPYKALDNAIASDRLPYIERVRSVAAEENKRWGWERAKMLPEHDPRPISLSTALTVGDFSAKTTCCRAVAARSSNWLQPCRSLARQLPHTSSSTIYIGYQTMIQTKNKIQLRPFLCLSLAVLVDHKRTRMRGGHKAWSEVEV